MWWISRLYSHRLSEEMPIPSSNVLLSSLACFFPSQGNKSGIQEPSNCFTKSSLFQDLSVLGRKEGLFEGWITQSTEWIDQYPVDMCQQTILLCSWELTLHSQCLSLSRFISGYWCINGYGAANLCWTSIYF